MRYSATATATLLLLSAAPAAALPSPAPLTRAAAPPIPASSPSGQAASLGPAAALRSIKARLPQIDWLAEGEGSPRNKVDVPDHVRAVLAQPSAPRREAESPERTARVRTRAKEAAAAAAQLRGMLVGEEDANAWWRTPRDTARGGRAVTPHDPLTVIVAGGGLAGLVTAAACHAKGIKVALFEQASSYAPYGGPIQIQSNALRALQGISPAVYEELVAAGTVTADRVSGLKIGYRKGNRLAGLYDRGDWLVRFDTIGPALEAGLPATVVVDRPVIQQILVEHGFPAGTVRIKSRVEAFEDLGDGRGVVATLSDGSKAYADVLVGADGVWSQVRKVMHGLGEGAGGFAASGAAGGALDEAEARRLAQETVRIAARADRRFSGFTCYAALAPHRASNIEDVSYQILLGEKKYFVSTDGGGERQQWFALIREPAGGVDPEPTDQDPHPKLTRLRRVRVSPLACPPRAARVQPFFLPRVSQPRPLPAQEFSCTEGDADGNVWDPFALELINASDEADIKRRDLYDGAPLLATWDVRRWCAAPPGRAKPCAWRDGRSLWLLGPLAALPQVGAVVKGTRGAVWRRGAPDDAQPRAGRVPVDRGRVSAG